MIIKKIIFKNCALFTKCMSKINKTQIDDVHDVDGVMSMYDLIEYSDNYSKTSGMLWHYCRDKPALATYGAIVDFTPANSIFNWIA